MVKHERCTDTWIKPGAGEVPCPAARGHGRIDAMPLPDITEWGDPAGRAPYNGVSWDRWLPAPSPSLSFSILLMLPLFLSTLHLQFPCSPISGSSLISPPSLLISPLASSASPKVELSAPRQVYRCNRKARQFQDQCSFKKGGMLIWIPDAPQGHPWPSRNILIWVSIEGSTHQVLVDCTIIIKFKEGKHRVEMAVGPRLTYLLNVGENWPRVSGINEDDGVFHWLRRQCWDPSTSALCQGDPPPLAGVTHLEQ